jgi:hypothetical protein
MPDPTCTICRKGVVGLPVNEGKQLFHPDCYVAYKHRVISPPQPQLQPGLHA